MKFRFPSILAFLTFYSLNLALLPLTRAAAATAESPWDEMVRVLERIKAPTFPARTYAITDYGAIAGGERDASSAIRKAIEAAHAAGGGRVLVAGGIFLSGPIHLKGNVELHVAEGATLRFTTDTKAYLPAVLTRWEGVECMNYSPFIYALDQENIAITGKGTLDGAASPEGAWWPWKGGPVNQKAGRAKLFAMGEKGVPVAQRVFGEGDNLRPNFIQPYRCKNILIEGVTMINSPMWEINPVLCTNVTVRGVKITSHGPNNDGCDPESSKDVLIEDCVFDTGDDCIAIKSGRNNDGRRVNVPSENIVVRRSLMKDGHGGVVIGSEISGGCRNVFVEDCEMDSPNLDRALRFKSNARRGGVVENVHLRNVKIGRVGESVLAIDFVYEEGADGDQKPVVRNVSMENVTATAAPRAFYIAGIPQGTIEGIHVSNCTISGVTQPEVWSYAGEFTLKNVSIIPAKPVRSANSRPKTEDE